MRKSPSLPQAPVQYDQKTFEQILQTLRAYLFTQDNLDIGRSGRYFLTAAPALDNTSDTTGVLREKEVWVDECGFLHLAGAYPECVPAGGGCDCYYKENSPGGGVELTNADEWYDTAILSTAASNGIEVGGWHVTAHATVEGGATNNELRIAGRLYVTYYYYDPDIEDWAEFGTASAVASAEQWVAASASDQSIGHVSISSVVMAPTNGGYYVGDEYFAYETMATVSMQVLTNIAGSEALGQTVTGSEYNATKISAVRFCCTYAAPPV